MNQLPSCCPECESEEITTEVLANGKTRVECPHCDWAEDVVTTNTKPKGAKTMNDLVQQLNAVKPKYDNTKYKAEAKAIGASALEFALAGKKAKEETKAVKTKAKVVDQEAKKALAEAKAKAKQEALAAKQAKAEAKAEAKAKEVKPVKGPTIASQTIDLILNTTKTNLEILAEIQANNAGCKTSYACIAWYRSKLRNEGKLAPRYPAKA